MSSATDVKEKERAKEKGKGKDAQKSVRPNPVALEVPVSVTWAKPAKADEKRDLFTEETVTVLVFKDAAVIQLAAAISIGQLVFLTHKKTNREVVCQVVQKRTFRPTSCYVEMEFTEPTDDFWGVAFPTSEEDAKVPAIAEVVAAQAPTDDADPETLTAPKREDVAQLKEEIQALRKQLQELKEQQGTEEKRTEQTEKDAAEREAAEREAAARRLEEAEERQAQEAEAAVLREKEATARRLAEAEAAARRAAEEEAEARKAAQAEATAKSEPEESHYAAQTPAEMEALAQRLAQAEAAARRAAEEEAAARSEAQANKSTEQPAAGVEIETPQVAEVKPEAKKDEEPPLAMEPVAETAAATTISAEQPAPETLPEIPAVRPKIAMRLPSLGAALETSAAPTEPPKMPPPPAATGAPGPMPPHEDDGLDDLLPKPALDFSKAKVVDPNDPFNIYRLPPKPPGIQEKLLAAGLVFLVLVGGGVAWYKNWLPFLHHEPKASAAAKSAPSTTPTDVAKDAGEISAADATNIAPKRAEAAVPTSGNAAGSAGGNAGEAAPSKGPSVRETASKHPVVSKPAAPTADAADTSSSSDDVIDPLGGALVKRGPSVAKDSGDTKAGGAKISKNRGKAVTSAESKPQLAADAVDDNAPVIPAKLLRSVPPIYPPDAMREYITGDVRIEAEVDATGRVGTMNVILGPAAFRQAAMDALRQYEYEPATQGGKPVASKVVVTVKFWFDP